MKISIGLKLFLILILSISTNLYACSCQCRGDCTFSKVSKDNDFVALIKVLEYSDYLDWENEEGDKMPYSITVEIIEKYKGSENRKKIKIWGDNGILCRPYINELKLDNYYLISPNKIKYDSDIEKSGDYDLFVCNVDFLIVDFDKKIAIGDYSKSRKKIELSKFKQELLE